MKQGAKAAIETEPAEARAVAASVRRGPVPLRIKTLARQMLAEGASAEEVIAAARAQGSGRVTKSTVRRWLGHDPKLRERALQRHLEDVERLERDLEHVRGPAKDRLLEAAQLVGLKPPSGSRLSLPKLVELHTSMWDSLQRENIALRQRALELQAQKASMSRRIEAVRTVVDRMRWQAVQSQLDQLWDVLNGLGAQKLASPLADTLRNLHRLAAPEKKAAGNR
jgi:hypothetical protein